MEEMPVVRNSTADIDRRSGLDRRLAARTREATNHIGRGHGDWRERDSEAKPLRSNGLCAIRCTECHELITDGQYYRFNSAQMLRWHLQDEGGCITRKRAPDAATLHAAGDYDRNVS